MADIDVVTSKLEDRILGVRTLASAVLGASVATPEEIDLAVAVLEASARNMTIDQEPREQETIAGAFNRHMDAVLDAANASREKISRVTRRADMARAIDAAGLVMLERSYVVALFASIEQMKDKPDVMIRGFDDTPRDVETASAYLDDVLAAQHPEIFKQWLIVREWIGGPVEGVTPNSELS